MSAPPIGLSIEINSVEHLAWIAERVFGESPVSHAYENTGSAVVFDLLAYGEESKLAQLGEMPRVPVIVFFKLRDDRVEQSQQVLRDMFMIAGIQRKTMESLTARARDEGSLHERARLQVVGYGVSGSAVTGKDMERLAHLRAIADQGVRILKLPSFALEGESLYTQTHVLRGVFPPQTESSNPSLGVDEIVIRQSLSPAMIVPVLSALHACPSGRDITLKMEQDPTTMSSYELEIRRKLWRWIVYALFSSHARHGNRSLTVDATFIHAMDVDEVKRVSSMTNPLEVLFDVEACKHHGEIQASRYHLHVPHGCSSHSETIFLTQILLASSEVSIAPKKHRLSGGVCCCLVEDKHGCIAMTFYICQWWITPLRSTHR